MTKKTPKGITLGEIKAVAKQIFDGVQKREGSSMCSLADAVIAHAKDLKLDLSQMDCLFNSVRWNLIKRLDKTERLPDGHKIALPNGGFLQETTLRQSIVWFEKDAVDYLLGEIARSDDGKHIVEISRSCSANMRRCEEEGLWFLYRAFEEKKAETDLLIEEAKIEYENKKATGYYDEQARDPKSEGNGSNNEDAERVKLLANVCTLFATATQETQRRAWKMMLKFTRKQWAFFTDSTKMLSRLNKIERARRVEEICRLTGLRDLFGKKPTADDKKTVSDVVVLLKADSIKAGKV